MPIELTKAYKCPFCKNVYEHIDEAISCEDGCNRTAIAIKQGEDYRKQEEALALQEAQKEAREIIKNPMIQLLARNGFCDKAKEEFAGDLCSFIEHFLPNFPRKVLTDEESPWAIGHKEIEALRDQYYHPTK